MDASRSTGIAPRDTMQDDISLDALDFTKSQDYARSWLVTKKNVPSASRYTRILHEQLVRLIRPESVKAVADAMGVSQGHLNDQVKGKKSVTLEALDQLARHRKRSVTQILTALRDISMELDRDEPGWDSTKPLSKAESTVQADDREKMADDLDAEEQDAEAAAHVETATSTPAAPRRSGKKQRS